MKISDNSFRVQKKSP